MDNLPHVFAADSALGGESLQVGDRLLQLVVTLLEAYICGKHMSVAGVTAFSKTFLKKVALEDKEEEKERIEITIGTTCHTCHTEWAGDDRDPRRRRESFNRV
jgi:hypothetical protein